MPSDREHMIAWLASHGAVAQKLSDANCALNAAIAEWNSTPAPALRKATVAAALGLLQAVDQHIAALPTGVQSIDVPLSDALAKVRHGAELLASMPEDPVAAAGRAQEAEPVLQDGYDGMRRATEAADRVSGFWET